MLRSIFLHHLLAGLLVSAYFLPKLVQSSEKFQPLAEKVIKDVAPATPAPAPPPEPLPAIEPTVAEPPPAPPVPTVTPPTEPPLDMSPFCGSGRRR
ncbi:MAG: hypothetical protein ACOYMN_08870 [Roseimicrobium sp.]